MACLVTVANLAFLTLPSQANDRKIDALAIALVTVPNIGIIFRRSYPSAMLLLATIPSFTYWVAGYPHAGAFLTLAVLLFSVPQYSRSERRSSLAQIVFFGSLLAVLITGYLVDSEDDVSIGTIISNLIFFQLIWLASQTMGARKAAIEKLRAEVEQSHKDQAIRTDQAVMSEQNRIARELHDIVAHSMSVVVVQAGGAKRLIGHDDDKAIEALDSIESTGRQTLSDIRGIVGLLRSGDSHQPAPNLAALDTLLSQSEQSGLSTSLEISGDQRELPMMVELSGYRIIQESLTNIRKHAGPNATATVRLTYEPDELRIVVSDNGRGSTPPSTTGGFGLVGMRERVEAFGGELRHGPQVGGGFAVEASLPHGSTP